MNPSNTALVIIDVQEKLLRVMHQKETLLKNVSILAQAAKVLEMPILWCQQYPKALGQTAPEVASHLEGVEAIDKMCFNCTGSSEFNEKLTKANVANVIVCGIESHICVYQTARQLKRKGYNVEVAADAVTSRTPENKQIAIDRLRAESIAISSTEMTLFDLLKTAKHEKFREISKLIK